MIVIPASLRSDFIHMAGMTIHIALESTIHIVGIRNCHKCAVPFDPICANSRLFNTSAKRFRSGLAIGKSLILSCRSI